MTSGDVEKRLVNFTFTCEPPIVVQAISRKRLVADLRRDGRLHTRARGGDGGREGSAPPCRDPGGAGLPEDRRRGVDG